MMGRGEHLPGLHSDPETVEKPKVALVCGDENPSLLSRVLEVKGIVSAPQTELHRRGDIMTVLNKEWREGQGNAFIEIEPGHALLDDKLIALDPLLDFGLVPFVITECGLEFFFSQSEGGRSLGRGMAAKIVSYDNPDRCSLVANKGLFPHLRIRRPVR